MTKYLTPSNSAMTAHETFEYFAGETKLVVRENKDKIFEITDFVNNVISGINQRDDKYNIITQMFHNCIRYSGHESPCFIKYSISKMPVYLSEPGYLVWADNGVTIYYWDALISSFIKNEDEDFQLTLDKKIIDAKPCHRQSVYNRPPAYLEESCLLKYFAIAYHLFCHYLDGEKSDYLHHKDFSNYLHFNLIVTLADTEQKLLGESQLSKYALPAVYNSKDITDTINSSRYFNSQDGLANYRTF